MTAKTSASMDERVKEARAALARVRRRADEPIPDGEGTLFDRTALWLAIEDQMRHINQLASGSPTLSEVVETYRATRLLYECRKCEYNAVREAQRAVGVAISEYIEAHQRGAFSPLRDLWTGLQQLLAEYRRIGGPVDREPCEGPPG